VGKLSAWRNSLAAAGLILFGLVAAHGQTKPAPKLEWDVASVRQNKSGPPESGGDHQSTNIPMGPENSFRDTAGVFLARNTPLREIISFAYKVTTGQRDVFRASLPDWVLTDRFDIEARTENHDVTKDEMRRMMQSLLAERFKLTMHRETREVPVYAVVLAKPGALGPQLRLHPPDDPCSTIAPPLGKAGPDAAPPPPKTTAAGYPMTCGGFANMEPQVEGHRREGARNMPMATVVTAFTGLGNLGRPAIDQTGLTGNVDFVIEFRQDMPGVEIDPSVPGPVFLEALKNQLGLKLESQKAPVEFILVDHVEHPTAN
jgi:uncharacterized protein (TIGR03435 family)